MIIGSLNNTGRVESLCPRLKCFFDYIKNHDLLDAPLGRIDVDGDQVYINNANPETVAADVQKLEIHREYIDVHVVLQGMERIGWKSLEQLKNCSVEYDAQGDYALYDEKADLYFDLKPGQFVIMFPEDAHAPLIGDGSKIRKFIGKVRV